MKTAICLKDVAAEAKVSIATASRILNGHKSGLPIREETRNRVRTIAREMDYHPNPLARSLRMKRTSSIGVIVSGAGASGPWVDAIEYIASQREYELLLAVSRWELESQEKEIKRLMRRRVDGIVLLAPAIEAGPRKLLERLIADHFPLVGIGASDVDGMSLITWDRAGAFEVIGRDLFFQRGCRRFAFVGTGTISPGIRQRLEGLQSALRDCPQAELHVFGYSEAGRPLNPAESAGLAREMIVAGKLDAVVCATDIIAMAVMGIAREAGVAVPGKLAVTGCGGCDFGEFMDVPLTTVTMEYETTARKVLDCLIHQIEQYGKGADRQPKRIKERVPARVVFRESSLFGGQAHSKEPDRKKSDQFYLNQKEIQNEHGIWVTNLSKSKGDAK